MSFKKFLKEQKMTYDDAVKILGLDDNFDTEELKKAYRVASSKNHPDKGGSVEAMQDVNLAFEFLSNSENKKQKVQSFRDRYEAQCAKYKQYDSFATNYLKERFKPQVFIDYLNLFFPDEKFTADVSWVNNSKVASPSFSGFNAVFSNQNKKLAFEFNVSVYLPNIAQESKGLTNQNDDKDISFDIMVESFGYANNKKQKWAKRSWGFSNNHQLFEKPELTFLPGKLKKIKSEDSVSGKLKRADFETALKHEIDAEPWGNDVWSINLKDGMLTMYRIVFMREAGWTVKTIGDPTKNSIIPDRNIKMRIYTFPETTDTIEMFRKFRNMTKEQVADTINQLAASKV